MTDPRTGMEPETFQPAPRVEESDNGDLFAGPIVKATADGTALDSVSPLKACPFCRGEASADGVTRFSGKHEAWFADGTRVKEAFYCNCMRCGINNQNIIGGHQTREKAIVAWNRRAPVSAQEADEQIPVSRDMRGGGRRNGLLYTSLIGLQFPDDHPALAPFKRLADALNEIEDDDDPPDIENVQNMRGDLRRLGDLLLLSVAPTVSAQDDSAPMHHWPDGQVREEEPYRCGAFIAATGEQCLGLSDHDGDCWFADSAGGGE